MAVSGDFAFTNIGVHPITISSVKSSCGCTTTKLEQTEYVPGEKGKITATFTMGERVGLQQKTIVVKTSHIEENLVQLTVRCFIPEYLKAEARTVTWALKGPNVARTIKFTAGTEQPVRVLGVQTTDERLFARLKPLEPGRAYAVELTVTSTDEPIRGYLRVNSDFPKEKPKYYMIPVSVGPLAPPRVVQYSLPPGAKPGSTPIARILPSRPTTPIATPVPQVVAPAPQTATPAPKAAAPPKKKK